MKPTKLLSNREYPSKYRSAQDLILAAVQKEELRFKSQLDGELRHDFRPHKCQMTEVTKRCFSKDIIKFMAP